MERHAAPLQLDAARAPDRPPQLLADGVPEVVAIDWREADMIARATADRSTGVLVGHSYHHRLMSLCSTATNRAATFSARAAVPVGSLRTIAMICSLV